MASDHARIERAMAPAREQAVRDRRTMLDIRTTTENDFSTIERWWSDPAYRAQLEAERVVEQAKINAKLDAHRDRELRRAGLI